MNLSELKPNTKRKSSKRVGRGGKRGFSSGHGTKGQKGRAGASVKPGFRGGDNRIWQLFPKQRGATKKPGNSRPHAKHRFFQVHHSKPEIINLSSLNVLKEGILTPEILFKEGLIQSLSRGVKILGTGELKKKFDFSGFKLSKSAKEKIEKAGGKINE